jgi:hypothetical protein
VCSLLRRLFEGCLRGKLLRGGWFDPKRFHISTP